MYLVARTFPVEVIASVIVPVDTIWMLVVMATVDAAFELFETSIIATSAPTNTNVLTQATACIPFKDL
jgi:hypothetical protein